MQGGVAAKPAGCRRVWATDPMIGKVETRLVGIVGLLPILKLSHPAHGTIAMKTRLVRRLSLVAMALLAGASFAAAAKRAELDGRLDALADADAAAAGTGAKLAQWLNNQWNNWYNWPNY